MVRLYVGYLGFEAKVGASLRRWTADQGGATAIEYGLIGGLIALVIIGVLTTIGTNLNSKLNSVASKM